MTEPIADYFLTLKATSIMHQDWRQLFTGQTVRAVNPDTGEAVNIVPYVRDPTKAEGLIIRFRYRDSSEISEHHVLCWRCWSSAETLFLSGLTATTGALKQFIIENISDLFDIHKNVSVPIPKLYFLSLAEISREDVQLRRLFNSQRSEKKKSCLLGLKVLTFISFRNNLSSQHESQVLESYLQARLGTSGTVGEKLINDLLKSAKKLVPTANDATKAATKIAKDEIHLDAIWIHSEILLSSGATIPASKLDRVKELIGQATAIAT